MLYSKVTQKGQATIPADIRTFLGVKMGDTVQFIKKKDRVEMAKAQPLDKAYLRSLQQTLTSEWNSEADRKAYDNL